MVLLLAGSAVTIVVVISQTDGSPPPPSLFFSSSLDMIFPPSTSLPTKYFSVPFHLLLLLLSAPSPLFLLFASHNVAEPSPDLFPEQG